MSFDTNWLLLSMVISGIGSVLVFYGKKQERMAHLLAGVIFVIYPYFVTNLLLMTLIAGMLGVALWLVVLLGA